MSNLDNLKPLIESLGKVVEQRKELEAMEKKLKAEIAPLLADEGTKQVGRYQVTVKAMPGRKTLDKTALEAAGINIDQFYKIGAPYTTTTVKVVDVL